MAISLSSGCVISCCVTLCSELISIEHAHIFPVSHFSSSAVLLTPRAKKINTPLSRIKSPDYYGPSRHRLLDVCLHLCSFFKPSVQLPVCLNFSKCLCFIVKWCNFQFPLFLILTLILILLFPYWFSDSVFIPLKLFTYKIISCHISPKLQPSQVDQASATYSICKYPPVPRIHSTYNWQSESWLHFWIASIIHTFWLNEKNKGH